MSKVICEREDLVAVADAVRSKTSTTEQMTLGEMANNIMNISSGGSGGGVVDVTELPDVGAEGSVYRLTSSTATEMWLVSEEGAENVTVQIAEIYVVDTLPDTMTPCDLDNAIFIIYVLNDTGIGYASTDGTSAMTAGTLLIGAEGFDKGWANNIESIDGTVAENMGIYFVRGKSFTTYNTYSNGLWTDYVEGEPTRERTASANFTDYAVLKGSGDGVEISDILDKNITSITISNSVTSIGYAAFQYCRYLVSVVIPDSVTILAVNSFALCDSLASVTIGNGVTTIGNAAFLCCPSLTSVTIGSGVTQIDVGAFQECFGLASITYNGTKEQWKVISKGDGWDLDTGDYTIYCTDGTIAKDGTET